MIEPLEHNDNSVRELELTRNVSLRELDPSALEKLRVSQSCTFSIPETVFDRDFPGHYLRRLNTLTVTIPTVVSVQVSIRCKLALSASTVRVSSELRDGAYARDLNQDPRFVDDILTVDSVVTSDTMVSEPFKAGPERCVPFDRLGAISTWELTLESNVGFDYSSIADVVLRINYTARDGGEALRIQVRREIR